LGQPRRAKMGITPDASTFLMAYTIFENNLQKELSFGIIPVVMGFRECFRVLGKNAFLKNWNYFFESRTNSIHIWLIGFTNADLQAFTV
jgi:hypothetical protein